MKLVCCCSELNTVVLKLLSSVVIDKEIMPRIDQVKFSPPQPQAQRRPSPSGHTISDSVTVQRQSLRQSQTQWWIMHGEIRKGEKKGKGKGLFNGAMQFRTGPKPDQVKFSPPQPQAQRRPRHRATPSQTQSQSRGRVWDRVRLSDGSCMEK